MATQNNRCTHLEFFKICEWMKANKETIERSRYGFDDMRKVLREAIQIEPSNHTISEAKSACGIVYEKKNHRNRPNGRSSHAIVKLARVLRNLMTKLGEPVPPQIDEVIDAMYSRIPNGVPVKEVPDPKTIAIVK